MSPKICNLAIDERETSGSNEMETSFEPCLTLLVSNGPKNRPIYSTNFRPEEVTKIGGKITVSF